MTEVLHITPKPFLPKTDGGCVAMSAFHQLLKNAGYTVFWATLSTEKHPLDPDQLTDEISLTPAHVRVTTAPRITGLIRSLFSETPYWLKRFYSIDFQNKIRNTIATYQPDIVILEGLQLAPYLPALKKSGCKLFLRTHNIESNLWDEQLSTMSGIKRLSAQLSVKGLRSYENTIFNEVDGIIAISPKEVEYVTTVAPNTPVVHIPTTIPTRQESSPFSHDFFHLGAMDWEPNKAGISWFINQVWTSFIHTESSSVLHLAGRKLASDLFSSVKKVVNHGEVNDSSEFMIQHGIMIVPVFQGSGIRIKILEAGSMGIPVIATPKAVEGLGLIPDKHFLQASTEAEFIMQMKRLIASPPLYTELGLALKEYLNKNYSADALKEKLYEFIGKA